MSSQPKILVVDDNPDSRFLLVKTLLRKFPGAVLLEEVESESALAAVATDQLNAVVLHRAADVDGLSLVRQVRQANSRVPIVMVSGIDRSKAATAAGATVFLHYDAWLRIGSIVADLLASNNASREQDRDADPATQAGK